MRSGEVPLESADVSGYNFYFTTDCVKLSATCWQPCDRFIKCFKYHPSSRHWCRTRYSPARALFGPQQVSISLISLIWAHLLDMKMMQLIWMLTSPLASDTEKDTFNTCLTPFWENLWLRKQRVNWLSPQNYHTNFSGSYQRWIRNGSSLWRIGISLVGNPVIPNAQTFRSILCKCKSCSHFWNGRQESSAQIRISSTSSVSHRYVDGIWAGTRVKRSVLNLISP